MERIANINLLAEFTPHPEKYIFLDVGRVRFREISR